MKEGMLRKGLVCSVIFLFIVVISQPLISTNISTSNITNNATPNISTDNTQKKEKIEPKDYLFETILDMANNSKVKELLKDNQKVIFNNLNYKSLLKELLSKNPKLFFSILCTKPSLTYDYLNLSYKQGIELVNIFGEDKISQIMQSVEITNSGLFAKLTKILNDDKILSDRIKTTGIMNDQLRTSPPFKNFPIICSILKIIGTSTLVTFMIFGDAMYKWGGHPILVEFFRMLEVASAGLFFAACGLTLVFNCAT